MGSGKSFAGNISGNNSISRLMLAESPGRNSSLLFFFNENASLHLFHPRVVKFCVTDDSRHWNSMRSIVSKTLRHARFFGLERGGSVKFIGASGEMKFSSESERGLDVQTDACFARRTDTSSLAYFNFSSELKIFHSSLHVMIRF